MKLKKNVAIISLEAYYRLRDFELTYGKKHTILIDNRFVIDFNPRIYTNDEAVKKLADKYEELSDKYIKLLNELNTLKAIKDESSKK